MVSFWKSSVCVFSLIFLNSLGIIVEELTLAAQIESKGTWEDDFHKNINKLLENDQPTYVMCRLLFLICYL